MCARRPIYEDAQCLQRVTVKGLLLRAATAEPHVTQPQQGLKQSILGAGTHVCRRLVRLQPEVEQIKILQSKMKY